MLNIPFSMVIEDEFDVVKQMVNTTKIATEMTKKKTRNIWRRNKKIKSLAYVDILMSSKHDVDNNQ